MLKLKDVTIDRLMNKHQVMGLSVTLINHLHLTETKGYGILSSETKRLVTSKSLFNTCSVSKFITALLTIKLSEMKLIDLDEDVNLKLTSWKISDNKLTRKQKVTPRLLLCHQSGIVDPEGSFREYKPIDGIHKISHILLGETTYCKDPIVVSKLPGEEFSYSDAGYCVIQQLIEDVIGVPFEMAVEKFIFKPLGIKNSVYASTKSEINHKEYASGHDKYGELISEESVFYPYPAAAGLWSTSSDLAMIVKEIMDSLKGYSKLGLSIEGAEEMISTQGSKDWAGLGVFLEREGERLELSSLGWGKGFQSMIVADPYAGSGAVILTNTDLGVHQMQGFIGELYRDLTFS